MGDIICYSNTGGIIMKDAAITVKLSKEEKARFIEFCNQVGLNPSSAINMFIATVINRWEIPFNVAPIQYSKEFLAARKEVEEMEKNPEKYKNYNSLQEMVDDALLEEDDDEQEI